jgi:RHS repeat-associated protein
MTTMLSLILAFMLTIGGSPADVVNPSGCLEASYIQALVDYGNGIDERIEIEKRVKNQDGNYEWKSYLPLHDSIGNVTALTNDKGHLIERYNYSPYGEVTYFNNENAPEVDNIKIENGKIRISFNRPVDLNDIFIDFYITATHSQIAGPKIIINMDRDIEFSPSQIPQNESLTIKIDAMDELSGGSTQPIQLLLKDFIYQGESSLLVHDQGPPRVERIEYESSSNCLVLDFNETINPSSITNSVEIEYGGNIITGSIEITGDNRIKFTPSGNLSTNVDYLIRVKDIKDAAGKTIEVFSYNFELNQAESFVFNYSILAKNTHSLYGNNSLMHGRDYEPEIGLYYFRNRYYHPQLGRFLQQDPNGYEDSQNMYQAFNQNPVNFTDPFGLYTDYYWEAKENKFRKKGPIDVNPADEMTRAALGQHAKNTAHNFGLVAIAQVPVVGKPFVAGYAVRQVGEGYIDAVEKRWNDVSVFDSGALKFLTRAASPFTGLFDLISSGPRNMYKAVTDPSLSGSEAGKSLMNGYNQTAWTSVAIIY